MCIRDRDEVVSVAIANVQGAMEDGEQTTSITILDDDIATLSISDEAGLEAELVANAPAPTFTVLTDHVSSEDINVFITVSDITTTLGEDYNIALNEPISVVIPAGESSAQVSPVTVIDDALIENDEQFNIELIEASIDGINSNRIIIGDSTGIGTIHDDDELPLPLPTTFVTLSLDPGRMAENGGQTTVTTILSEATTDDVVVNFDFSGDATIGIDYTASAQSITIPAGETTGAITLNAIDDFIDEMDGETVDISIESVTNAVEDLSLIHI